jgi:hypothetical protein
MEFKIKVRIDNALIKALGIDEDTVFETYFDDGEIVIRPVSAEEISELSPCEDCPFDSKCICDTDEEPDDIVCPEGVESCEECEYFCPHCGRCVLEG